jgi:hypothetical protein
MAKISLDEADVIVTKSICEIVKQHIALLSDYKNAQMLCEELFETVDKYFKTRQITL